MGIKCPVCGNAGAESLKLVPGEAQASYGRTTGYKIYECGSCMSAFSDPMRAAPPSSYHQNEFYGWRREFGWFLEDARAVPAGGMVLEIGCGDGLLLEKLGGFDACGVDFNGDAVQKARAKGLKAHVSGAAEFLTGRPGVEFKAVAAFHILEHMEDPKGLLLSIYRALEPGGLFAVSVPNPDRCIFSEKLREDWDYPPHHLLRFSAAGLGGLLDKCGFRVMKKRPEPWNLGYSAVRLAGFINDFYASRLGLDITGLPWLVRNFARLAVLPLMVVSNPQRTFSNFFKGGQSLYILAKKEGRD